MTLKRNSVKHF